MDIFTTLFLMMHMCTHMSKFPKMYALNMFDSVYIKNASIKLKEKKSIHTRKKLGSPIGLQYL